jgi:hypothetical protein
MLKNIPFFIPSNSTPDYPNNNLTMNNAPKTPAMSAISPAANADRMPKVKRKRDLFTRSLLTDVKPKKN